MVDPLGLEAGDWWDVPANYACAHEIAKEEVSKRGTGNHNNAGDAMRHAEWSRRMYEEIGPFTSWLAGVAHEFQGLNNGEPWAEAMMDIHNNAEGRAAAAEHRPIAPQNLQTPLKNGFQFNPYSSNEHGVDHEQ